MWDELRKQPEQVQGLSNWDLPEGTTRIASHRPGTQDGGEVEINDYHEYEIDWKYPKKTYVYDKNMNELGEI